MKREEGGWRDVLADRHFPAFMLLCFGIWLHAADSMLTATVIPVLVVDIGGAEFIAWTMALYVLASIVAGSAAGLAARRLGMKAAICGGALVYGLGCAVSALAPDMAVMLVGRAMQGFGGGAMVALAYVALTALFPARMWPRLYACISGIWGGASLCGPLIGGLFAEAGLWRGAFWAFGGQAALLLLLFLVFLPRTAPEDGVQPAVPWGRLGLVALGVLGIAVAGILLSVAPALIAGLGGIAVLAVAAGIDRRQPRPILPRGAFGRGSVAGAGYLMILGLSIATMPFTTYGPILMEQIHGTGPLVVGYVIAAESIAWTITSVSVSGAGPAWERRLILGGASIITLGMIGLGWAVPYGGLWPTLVFAALQGGGAGFCWSFVTRRIVHAVAGEEKTLAAAAVPTVQLLGYALGAAGAGIIANAGGLGTDPNPVTALATAPLIFLLFAPFALAGIEAARRATRA